MICGEGVPVAEPIMPGFSCAHGPESQRGLPSAVKMRILEFAASADSIVQSRSPAPVSFGTGASKTREAALWRKTVSARA